jgi:hypothetical protein
MAALFGGGRVNGKTPPATSLRIQTALNGQPIPIVHGRNRLAGNLIWYGGFAYTGPGKGGKGGGGGKSQPQQTSYSADVVIGLAEGPLCYFGTVWSGQSIMTAAEQATSREGFSSFDGMQGQSAWSWMETAFPQYALGYTCLGYVGYNPMQLGQSPALPNLNYEIGGSVGPAISETLTIPATGSPVLTPTWWNLSGAVVEQATIPATTPYQYAAQNPYALTSPLIAGGAHPVIKGSHLPGSDSQGVIDVNGRVFTRVTGSPTVSGTYAIAGSTAATIVYTFAAADAGLAVTVIDFAQAPGVAFAATGEPLTQVLGTPGAGQFSVSVQPGSYGQYTFAVADAGKQVVVTDIPDADPSASLTDYLSNARYGCGFPSANIGDFATLQTYAFATGLFISPAWVAPQAANDYLNDFSTGLNGEFVWSGGSLTFVAYGDTAINGFGKTYTPPRSPIYSLDDDDFLRNEGAGVGGSAFASDDPVVCVRTRPSDAYNDVKIQYLDRGNSYNPAIAEAQDDAAINEYGLRPADTKQLHLFCDEAPALMSAQLQLGRQQVRNRYGFTVPWYFILLDPMDIVAISDPALGLDNQWVRILEITENQQDGTLTMTAEEYLQGTASVMTNFANQPRLGYTPNMAAPAAGVN